VFEKGANGNWGEATEKAIQEHLKVSEISKEMYHNLINAKTMGKVQLSDAERAKRGERIENVAGNVFGLVGQVFSFKTAKQQKLAAEAQERASANSPQQGFYPQQPQQPASSMGNGLKIGVGLGVLLLVVALIFVLTKPKKDAPKDE
jgi:uncharacterized protein YcgL (UPF0745 family)